MTTQKKIIFNNTKFRFRFRFFVYIYSELGIYEYYRVLYLFQGIRSFNQTLIYMVLLENSILSV